MVFMYIDKKNCIQGKCNMITKLDTYLGNKNTKTFLLIFMEGCNPCNATRPEWSKIKNVLPNRNDVVVASIDHELADKLKNLKDPPHTYPSMKYITNGVSEDYENSNITGIKDRKIDSFIEWIKSKIGEIHKKRHKYHDQTKKYKNIYKYNKTNKHNKYKQIYRGGGWSRKYKRIINCKRPKGFSQKQYCKYGRK